MEGYIIEVLPNEIIEKIIGCNVLSHYDVINFGSTCSKFRSLVNNSNRVWKCKFIKRWPQLLKLYNPKQVYNWLAEFQLRVNKGALVRQYVASMSSKMYHLEEIQDSSLAEMEAMINDHERSYHFIMDELINKGNPLRNSDLTEVYYAEKLVCCLKKQQLKKFWNNFKQVPPEEQLLEKGAVFVAKWIQSSMAVSPVLVSRQLDLLAEAVREVLRSRHPFHSIFSTPLDLVEQWKQKALTDNQFGPSECQQVLVALGEVIFNHSGFYTDNNMHYNVDNACINMVGKSPEVMV
ncbi:unnamed protein product [Timema podura]|uniref:F-box domain-containing protein n=1 Tax=Timema podura TaxID=61482 RepID=A0ABN7PGA1_TIMPD|nr:unnamed protein product [Timema podura]